VQHDADLRASPAESSGLVADPPTSAPTRAVIDLFADVSAQMGVIAEPQSTVSERYHQHLRTLIAEPPLRNRTVDLLLTMGTTLRPGRPACTNSTARCTERARRTEKAPGGFHSGFHAQLAGSAVFVTLSRQER
jgi:hypothetical protein